MQTPFAISSAPPVRSRSAASFLRASSWGAVLFVVSSISPWCVTEAAGGQATESSPVIQMPELIVLGNPPPGTRPARAVSRQTSVAGDMSVGSDLMSRGASEPQREVLARDFGMPQTSNVLQLPDDATETEVQGQYVLGMGLLLLGALLTMGTLYGLMVVLLKNTWGDHAHAHAGGRPH
ncbi:MAG TPA: hypothetical protein VJU61_10660 [Polyangiaceae bacterium]|nr:hypothetical protein [Polyangiaceae bacterium]